MWGKRGSGTFFAVVYPNTFLASPQDGVRRLDALLATARTRVTPGVCRGKRRVDVAEVVRRHFGRWETSRAEDNEISKAKPIERNSRPGVPGRFSLKAPTGHGAGR